MERQIGKAQRKHDRLHDLAYGEQSHEREQQSDARAGGEQYASDVEQIAWPREAQRADQKPGGDRREDERKCVDHLWLVVPAHAGTQ